MNALQLFRNLSFTINYTITTTTKVGRWKKPFASVINLRSLQKYFLNDLKVQNFLGHHSSVDLSAPTIQRSRVRITSNVIYTVKYYVTFGVVLRVGQK